MRTENILVAVDFEQASMRALDLGKRIAKAFGGTVTLVHVYQLPIYTYPGLEPTLLPGFHAEVAEAARGALERLSAEVSADRSLLHEGDPAAEILSAAKHVGATMIAMGTHGRRGLAHALLGSVAERVLRQSPVPVLTVRAP